MCLSALIKINCCSLNQYKKKSIRCDWCQNRRDIILKHFRSHMRVRKGKKKKHRWQKWAWTMNTLTSVHAFSFNFICCARCLNPTYLSHIFSLSSILLKARRNLWWSLLCICLYSQRCGAGNPCQRACMACWHQRLTDTDALACHHLKGLAQL